MLKTVTRTAALCVVLLGQVMTGFGQQSGGAVKISAPPLRIGPGDLIDVNMFDNPDLSGHFRVDSNGDIVVPLLGRVHVQGETEDGAGALIQERYVEAQILNASAAHAMVFIAEYATQGITVNGQVKSPGVYPALGVRMLNDVITAAGGETPTAASHVVITHREDPDHPETVAYNPEALQPKLPQVQVFPGDTVMVPRAGIIYVVGAVSHPGGFVLEGRNGLTVETAMALAGGGLASAGLNQAQLVRTLKDGRKEAITVKVSRIFKGKDPDMALKDGDILYVPKSGVKVVGTEAIAPAISIASTILLWRVAYQ